MSSRFSIANQKDNGLWLCYFRYGLLHCWDIEEIFTFFEMLGNNTDVLYMFLWSVYMPSQNIGSRMQNTDHRIYKLGRDWGCVFHRRKLFIVQAPNPSDAFNFQKNILGHLSCFSSMYFYHNHYYEKNVPFSIDCIAENFCFWIDLNILNTACYVKTLNPNSEVEEALILWKVVTFLLQKGRKEMRRK